MHHCKSTTTTWFNKLFVPVPDREEAEHITRLAAGWEPLELDDVIELPLHKKEQLIIDEALYALNQYRNELGYQPITISPTRIHVCAKKELFRHKCRDRAGLVHESHVVLRRRRDLQEFACTVAHEFVHVNAFHGLLTEIVETDSTKQLFFHTRQRGMRWIPRLSSRIEDAVFSGLDEGVTELIAIQVRKRMRHEHLPFTKHNTFITTFSEESRSYRYHVMLIDQLSEDLSVYFGRSTDDIMMILIHDYFSGTRVFVRMLEKWKNGILRQLAHMGTETFDVGRFCGSMNIPLRKVHSS